MLLRNPLFQGYVTEHSPLQLLIVSAHSLLLTLSRRVFQQVPKGEFVQILADHVPERYRHSVRYYGLLAPRFRSRAFAILFKLLGQKRRPRPRRLSWAEMIMKYFKRNPLIDSHGQSMRYVGRHCPVAA